MLSSFKWELHSKAAWEVSERFCLSFSFLGVHEHWPHFDFLSPECRRLYTPGREGHKCCNTPFVNVSILRESEKESHFHRNLSNEFHSELTTWSWVLSFTKMWLQRDSKGMWLTMTFFFFLITILFSKVIWFLDNIFLYSETV